MTLQQTTNQQSDDIRVFVAENRDFITRVLAYGDTEARGYALALLANGGSVSDIEQVQRALQQIKEDRE